MAESHADLFSLQSQLGRNSIDMNEARLENFNTKTLLYNQLNNNEKAKVSADDEREVESDVVKVPAVYSVGKATTEAAGAFGRGTVRGLQAAARAGGVSAEEAVMGSGNVLSNVGVRDVGSAVARGLRGAGKSLASSDAAQGTKLFATKLFGEEGVTPLKDIGGFEGIAARTLGGEAAGAGAELFGKVAGKAVGQIGTGIAVYQDVDNFFQTGNIFNSKNADGTIQKNTLGEDIGNIATIGAGALDVLAAFTGGALAPIALAANIAAATESTVATAEADSAQQKTDEANPPPAKPPPPSAPAAFGQYGLLANQSHNPLNHIG